MQERLEKYSEFIEILTKTLEGFFEEQKEFIKCSMGCSRCCTTGYYPVTEIEFEYMKKGFEKLDKAKQELIRQNCFDLYRERKIFLQEGNQMFDFSYKCPFLFDDLCSIYENRAIICRTHGLMSISLKGGNNFNIPTCVYVGLNYSNVWDEEIKSFSMEKAKKLNLKTQPAAYPVGYQSILENIQDIRTGSIRMMFEWVIINTPNYQEKLAEINKNL